MRLSKMRMFSRSRCFLSWGLTRIGRLPPLSDKELSIALVSDRTSWLNSHISQLALDLLHLGHQVMHVHDIRELNSGDLCFYLSFSRIVKEETLKMFTNNLVVHSSNLPHGKGFSPLTWQVLEGKNHIKTILFEAVTDVDDGDIYLSDNMTFSGHELINELRAVQATVTKQLVLRFIQNYPEIIGAGVEQLGDESFYRKRSPKDSELDPSRSIIEQFNLLRVVDNEFYPAFFRIGARYYDLRISERPPK